MGVFCHFGKVCTLTVQLAGKATLQHDLQTQAVACLGQHNQTSRMTTCLCSHMHLLSGNTDSDTHTYACLTQRVFAAALWL